MRIIRTARCWLLMILACSACSGLAGCWDKTIHEASFNTINTR